MCNHPRKVYLFFHFNRKENDGYYILQANKTTIRTSYFKHPDFTRRLFEGEKGE